MFRAPTSLRRRQPVRRPGPCASRPPTGAATRIAWPERRLRRRPRPDASQPERSAPRSKRNCRPPCRDAISSRCLRRWARALPRAPGAEEAIARDKALKEAQTRISELEKTLKDLQRALELKGQTGTQLQAQADAAKGKAPEPAKVEPPKIAAPAPEMKAAEPPKAAAPAPPSRRRRPRRPCRAAQGRRSGEGPGAEGRRRQGAAQRPSHRSSTISSAPHRSGSLAGARSRWSPVSPR